MSNVPPGPQGSPPGDDPGSQRRYYQRYEQASGEAVTAPNKTVRTRRRGVLYSLVAVGAAVVVAAGVLGVTLLGGDEQQRVRAGATATSAPPPTSRPTDPTTDTWTNPSADSGPTTVRALSPGWTSVLARPNLASAAYDVPNAHWYKPGDMIYGFTNEAGDNPITVGSASGYRHGYCKTDPGAVLGFVGFRGIGSMDPVDKAPDVAREFAKAISVKKDQKSHAPTSEVKTKGITVQGLPAVQSTVTATDGDPDEKSCDAKKLEVRTVGVTMGNSAALLVLVRAVDVPHALTDAQADAIIQTLRPAGG